MPTWVRGSKEEPPTRHSDPPQVSGPYSCNCPLSQLLSVSPKHPEVSRNRGLLSAEFTSNKPLSLRLSPGPMLRLGLGRLARGKGGQGDGEVLGTWHPCDQGAQARQGRSGL